MLPLLLHVGDSDTGLRMGTAPLGDRINVAVVGIATDVQLVGGGGGLTADEEVAGKNLTSLEDVGVSMSLLLSSVTGDRRDCLLLSMVTSAPSVERGRAVAAASAVMRWMQRVRCWTRRCLVAEFMSTMASRQRVTSRAHSLKPF